MSNKIKNRYVPSLSKLAQYFRDWFHNSSEPINFILLYAHNGTGKTRLSMEFKDRGKKKKERPDTLYFNAYTEDLFYWDNDLENDTRRVLLINKYSKFLNDIEAMDMENKIRPLFQRYVDTNFSIDYKYKKKESDIDVFWAVNFIREENINGTVNNVDFIKVSRGEENIFIWCTFLAICQLVIDGDESYNWVEYIYIDDPISSLDDNNVIAVASDLAQLLKKGKDKVKTVVSSHHTLFFNVMCNELRKEEHRCFFLHKNKTGRYILRATDETPFFHHIALLSELKQVRDSGKIQTYHFNTLRSILEKTAVFFGYTDFSDCIHGVDDEVLYARALNLLSHGKYSVFQPVEMGDDTKELFIRILDEFLKKYEFALPDLLN